MGEVNIRMKTNRKRCEPCRYLGERYIEYKKELLQKSWDSSAPVIISKQQKCQFGLNREGEEKRVEDEFIQAAWRKDHVGPLHRLWLWLWEK